MSASKEIDVRKQIGIFVEKNPDMKVSEMVRVLGLSGIKRSTAYTWINRLKSGESVDRKPGSGQHRAINKKIKDKIIEFSVNQVGISYRFIGRKYGVHHRKVKEILEEAGVERKKRKKCPKSSVNQVIKQKKCLEKLRRTLFKPSNNIDIILDDESYFTTDGSETNVNDFYYSYEGLEVPENVRFKPVSKFPKKVLVWVAMSSKGFSEPYVVPSGNAINSDVYIDECVTRLKDFINKYHSDGNYIFWPDLASAHYSNKTQGIFRAVGIKYLEKSLNPPNVPQIRPIERFWAILQKKLYINGWTTEDINQLIRRIKNIIKNSSENLCQNLMRGLKTKVRKAADRGPLSVLN